MLADISELFMKSPQFALGVPIRSPSLFLYLGEDNYSIATGLFELFDADSPSSLYCDPPISLDTIDGKSLKLSNLSN